MFQFLVTEMEKVIRLWPLLGSSTFNLCCKIIKRFNPKNLPKTHQALNSWCFVLHEAMYVMTNIYYLASFILAVVYLINKFKICWHTMYITEKGNQKKRLLFLSKIQWILIIEVIAFAMSKYIQWLCPDIVLFMLRTTCCIYIAF